MTSSRVTIVRLLVLGCLPSLSSVAAENPCRGKGTAIFFVNGVFNDQDMARENLRALEKVSRPALSHVRNLKYGSAFVEDMGFYPQLAMAVAQRGVDDFQRFWLWMSGLEKAPKWFTELVDRTLLDPRFLDQTAFDRITKHLELYSDAILEGYEVILVSHSVGNFYANAAMRTLPTYVSEALQPSLAERHVENPSYPKPEELVSNIQIGSPVAETVNDSPWVNFKDDSVVNTIRKVVRVLPGNVDSSGVSEADGRGHSLIPSYLRVLESRERILQHMKAAHRRMRYPIPYFRSAATVGYDAIVAGRSRPGLFVQFLLEGHDISTHQERRADPQSLTELSTVSCYRLKPDSAVQVRAQIPVTDGSGSLRLNAFKGEADSSAGTALTIPLAGTHTSHWKLGSVVVRRGEGKEPITAAVEFLDRPEPESESEPE